MLGPVEIMSGPTTSPPGGFRQRLVLAVLLSRPNRVLDTDWLIDAVWGEHPPRTARKTLQVYVTRLRKLVGAAAIGTSPAGYRLSATADSLDSLRFESLARQGRELLLSNHPHQAAGVLREALALWRGAPFGDLADVPALRAERSRLQEAHVAVREDRLDADLACGHGSDLVPELTGLVAAHPLRERLRGQLMHALYRAQRQADALATYEEMRTLLADELGADPGIALRRLHERILRQDGGLDASVPTPPTLDRDVPNPYKGLRPFNEQDAADFFGRDDLVDELLRMVTSRSLVAVVGPSGCGKSSVVRAGLAPRLRAGEPSWRVLTITPGAHPFEAFAESVRGAGARGGEGRGDRLDMLRTLQSLLTPERPRLLLIVDQFEELETLTASPADRQRYLDNISEIVEDPMSGIVVLLTIRADFFDRVLAVPVLGQLALDGLVGVVPMSPAQIEAAATAPARRADVRLEPELAAELVADMANHPGALPLFQFALTETFDARTGKTLTQGDYRAVGGLRGALALRAEETFQTLADAERSAARQLFLRLVSIGPGAEGTRRRILRREIEPRGLPAEAVASCLDAFDRARLLTFDRDPATGEATVELAHEALIGEWSRFSAWVQSARDDLRLYQRLSADAATWEAGDRNPGYLLAGSRLDAYAGWPRHASIAPTLTEQEYLDVSRTAQQARAARRRRAARRLRVLVAALAVAALSASVLLAVSVQNSMLIAATAQASKARELAAAAHASVGVDSDLSLLLALKAQESADASGAPVAEAVAALHHALVENRLLQRYADVADVAFLADGRLVVAGEQIRVVDLAHDADVQLAAGLPAVSVAASDDGRWIATGHSQGRISVWDAQSGARVVGFPADPPDAESGPDVLAVDFAPTGNHLASVGAFGWGLDVWSVESGTVEARRVSLHGDHTNLSFAADGSRALVTVRDGVAALTVDGRWLPVVTEDGVTDVVSLGQGSLATAGADGAVRLWDADGKPAGTLKAGDSALTALSATPGHSRIAASDTDGDVHVWNRTNGTWAMHVQFSASNWELVELALDPSGDLLAGVDASGTAYVWSVADERPGEYGSWPGGGPVAVSTNGNRLAVAGTDSSTATVRRMPDGSVVADLTVPATGDDSAPPLVGLTYFPDGTKIVGTTDRPGPERVLLQVWDAQTGLREASQQDQVAVVGPAAVSAGGDVLAVACCGDTTSAWLITSARLHPVGVDECGRAVDLDTAGSLMAVQTAAGDVHVWDVESSSGRGWEGTPTPQVMSAVHRPASTGSVAFSPDDSMLLTAGVDGAARVWDVRSGEQTLVLDGGGGPVEVAIWTSDGSRILTSSHDGVVRVWSYPTGHLVAELPAHDTWPHLAVTPDGRRVLTSADDVVRSWTLDTDELVDTARERLTRGLSVSECERYGIDPCTS